MLVQGMRTVSTRGKTKGQEVVRAVPGGLVLFWLVPSVTQEADETVMPDERNMNYEAAPKPMNIADALKSFAEKISQLAAEVES